MFHQELLHIKYHFNNIYNSNNILNIIFYTKMVYRSLSSHIYILIQLSHEMWSFDQSGDLLYERALDNFLRDLLIKWNTIHASHSVTCILYTSINILYIIIIYRNFNINS